MVLATALSYGISTPRCHLASFQRAARCTEVACIASPHPDALKRAQERELRQLALQELIEVEKHGEWWTVASPENVLHVHSPIDFGAAVASANRTDRLVVVHFFRPDCAGCKAMWPKALQIYGQHPDVTFIKVNTGDELMRTHCERMGLSKLPYFQFYHSGRLVTQFTCNLSTIKRLKTALSTHRTSPNETVVLPEAPWAPAPGLPAVAPQLQALPPMQPLSEPSGTTR